MLVQNRKTQTVQLRASNVHFYQHGMLIPNMATRENLMQADGVELCMDDQKNGTRGECVHIHVLPGNSICLVGALARRVLSVIAMSGSLDESISRLTTANAMANHATAAMVHKVVCHVVTHL